MLGVAIPTLTVACSSANSAGPGGSTPAGTQSSAPDSSGSATGTPSALNPPVTVSFAVSGLATEAGLFVAADRGYFKSVGITPKFIPSKNFSNIFPLLATGQLDYATGGLNPNLFNAENSGVDVKIVAANAVGVPNSAPAALVVRKDLVTSGRYKSPANLKGMKIAINELGTSSELFLTKMLAQGHLTIKDVTVVPLGFTDMPPALQNKSVDAVFTVEPFVNSLVHQGLGVKEIIGDQAFPGAVDQIIAMSPKFAAANPAAADRVMYAFLEGQRDYLNAFINGKDTGDQAAIVKILAKHTILTDPKDYQGMGMSGGEASGEFSLNVMQQYENYFVQQKTLAKPVANLSNMVDFSYVQWAVPRLGIN
jgi:NitT/TauT family transport system substrate-binding protein